MTSLGLGPERPRVLIPLPPVSNAVDRGGVQRHRRLQPRHRDGRAVDISLNGASIARRSCLRSRCALRRPICSPSPFPEPRYGPCTCRPRRSRSPSRREIPLKDTYYARCGDRRSCGLELRGRLDLGILMGGGAVRATSSAPSPLLPALRFTACARWSTSLRSRPSSTWATSTGNGNMTEHVPDYANFPAVPQAPDTRRRFATILQVAHLPFVSGGNANALIVIGGVILPGVGFVPLGLDANRDMGGSGIVPAFTSKIAPPHGGLEVATTRCSPRGAPQRRCVPGPGSARLFVGSSLPASV